LPDRLADIPNLQTQPSVSGAGNRLSVRGRNEFKQDAIHVEAGNEIVRDQIQAEDLPIEGDGAIHVADVVEHRIERQF
jgi:hypothetical protein